MTEANKFPCKTRPFKTVAEKQPPLTDVIVDHKNVTFHSTVRPVAMEIGESGGRGACGNCRWFNNARRAAVWGAKGRSGARFLGREKASTAMGSAVSSPSEVRDGLSTVFLYFKTFIDGFSCYTVQSFMHIIQSWKWRRLSRRFTSEGLFTLSPGSNAYNFIASGLSASLSHSVGHYILCLIFPKVLCGRLGLVCSRPNSGKPVQLRQNKPLVDSQTSIFMQIIHTLLYSTKLLP